MKVAMVGPYPEPGAQVTGGVERVIDTLMRELADRVELTLFVPGASRDAEGINRGVRTIYLKRGPGPGALRYWTFDAHRLTRALESLRPDLVHLQGVAGVGRLLRLPTVLTIHGIVHRDLVISARGKGWGPVARYAVAKVMRIIEARAQQRIGNVIIINPYVLEALPDVKDLRTFAIPNPVDPAFLETATTDAVVRERRVVSVGLIGPRKATYELLSIVADLMKLDTSLTLAVCGQASDEVYYQRCRELIRSEGLEDRITFSGNLTASQLIQMLDGSSCLLMASRQETAPMAIAEAHARGVAVVAPEAFGIRYMIEPSRNGFFLPKDHLNTQAAVLRRALDHNWDHAAIAREARETYSSQHVAERTLAVYREIMAACKTASYRVPS